MKIVGTDGLTTEQIRYAISNGSKFVLYQYSVSLVFISFRRSSDIYFVPPGNAFTLPRVGYSLLSLVAGWWGIPWGPIYTVQALWTNLSGGRDVTREILAQSSASAMPMAKELP
jgi:hypothetical protein